jgi:hypothetical protein
MYASLASLPAASLNSHAASAFLVIFQDPMKLNFQ